MQPRIIGLMACLALYSFNLLKVKYFYAEVLFVSATFADFIGKVKHFAQTLNRRIQAAGIGKNAYGRHGVAQLAVMNCNMSFMTLVQFIGARNNSARHSTC